MNGWLKNTTPLNCNETLMRALALSFLFALAACAHAPVRPAGFVDAAGVVPGLRVEMRYAGRIILWGGGSMGMRRRFVF